MIELISDPEIFKLANDSIIGGISLVSGKYSRADNEYTNQGQTKVKKEMDGLKTTIKSFDANSLYPSAMTTYMPTNDFKMVSDISKYTNEFISSYSDEASIGFGVYLDWHIPEELHDTFNDYPITVEKKCITADMLSPKQLERRAKIASKINRKEYSISSDIPKVVPNLCKQTDVFVHYRFLKMALRMGVKIDKIHSIMTFNQAPIFKEFIDLCVERRRNAVNEEERDLWKLCINSLYGKFCENLDKRLQCVAVNSKKQLLFQTRKIVKNRRDIAINKDLVFIQNSRNVVMQNRPKIIGNFILQESKRIMFEFYYDVLKAKFGEGLRLLASDTDSLKIEVKTTEDFELWCWENRTHFDNSKMPLDFIKRVVKGTEYESWSEEMLLKECKTNEKQLFKFKDEGEGVPIECFYGMKSKMYCQIPDETYSTKLKIVCKGLARIVKDSGLNESSFKNSFDNDSMEQHHFTRIQSVDRVISTVEQSKWGINALDTKRYELDGGYTLAHGHYKIAQLKK